MVSKDVLKWSHTIAVDPSEVLALPEKAREIVKGKAGVTPKIFIMNPGLTESYGEFNHSELSKKDWGNLFKEAKGAVRTAVSAGTFAPAEEVVTIATASIETWESAAGTAIEAKLVAVEDDTVFVFETPSGKTIRATADKLSEASVKRAQALAKE